MNSLTKVTIPPISFSLPDSDTDRGNRQDSYSFIL